MIKISYEFMFAFITIIWCLNRIIIGYKHRKFSLKRELQLLLVYICIVVIVRFTFCPFGKVDGKIQPLILYLDKIYPFRMNLEPLVHMNDYAIKKEAILNFAGNILMFVPVGIVFPIVDKKLNTPIKAILGGIGCSLLIEVLQLPFYDRLSDVDDLILNSLGYIIGYLIYLSVKKIVQRHRRRRQYKKNRK